MKRDHLFFGLLLSALLLMAVFLGKNALVKADPAQEVIRTTDTQTILCGEADPGDAVVITVYSVRENQTRIILFSTRLEVGSSGLYQASIPLPIEGEQFVSVSINNVVETTRYVRYSSGLGETLSGTYLNVYEFLQEDRQ